MDISSQVRTAVFCCIGVCLSLTAVAANAAEAKPMNVMLILADDLGWSDTTLYGGTKLYETPNIERLAQRGMTFNRAYSASPLCSPTRSSILTGQNPARTGITTPSCHMPQEILQATVAKKAPPGEKSLSAVSVTRLKTSYPTLGKLLKQAGYATAHFGKWHLGHEPYSPLEHGFEVDIPHWPGPGPAGSFVAPWKFPDFKENYPQEHIEDRMAEEAVHWLKSLPGDRPFYMNYWQFSVHAPFNAKQSLIDYYRPKIDPKSPQRSPTYAAMVHSLDDAVGSLLDAVDKAGIADHTAIVFFSDNGGNMYNEVDDTTPTSNVPLRGGKATMYEGGIRVPCIIVWPGITTPGSRSNATIQSTDLYPTILTRLGIALPPDHPLDGVDISPALAGDDFDRGAMFTFFPHSPGVPDWLPPSVAVHRGDWKLIRLFHCGENNAHDYRLYNLADDIGEQHNLAAANPMLVRELDRLIDRFLLDTAAVVPLPNPDFDPAKYRPELIGVQKQQTRSPRKPTGKPAAGRSTAGGWRAKGNTVGLEVANGELIARSTAGDPWFHTDQVPHVAGPFTFEFDIHCETVGQLATFAAWNGKSYVPGSFIATKIDEHDEWIPVSVRIPNKGTLTSLRIDPPGTVGATRFRKIRLLDGGGKTIQQWNF